jgi:AraC-like DNA-binding protein
MKLLDGLNYFGQFLEILSIFQLLATTKDYELLHEQPFENQYNKKDQQRIKRLYQFINENYQRNIDLKEIANLSNLSEAAFCRYFKKMTRVTFTEFLNHYRVNQAKNLLLLDKNVTETCFDCGFESMSYFNRTFKKLTGENPLAFKKRYFMK